MSRSQDFARFAATKAISSDLKQKSVLEALTMSAGSALDFAVRLGSTLILARLLVPEHFGLVAMVTALTRMAERFATLGLTAATVQAPDINHEQCSNLFWINAAAGFAFAGGLILFSPLIVEFYDEARLQPIALALSLNFVGTGLNVQHEALLRRQMKLTQVVGNRLAATLLSVCVAVALALGGAGYWALVWKEVVQATLIAAGSWMLCRWVPALPRRRVGMGRLLTFGRDLTLTQVLTAVTLQLDSLLIGRFGTAAALGLYRQAYNLMMTPVEKLKAPIYGVSQPGLSILQNEPARYRRYYRRILFVITLATIPLGIFMILYAREIILVALGEQWVGAAVFVQILGVAAATQPALGTNGIVMVTCGKTGRYFFVSLASNLMLVTLMLAGIPWGATGIAAGRVAAPVLLMPALLYYSFQGTPVSLRDFAGSVWRPAVAALAMGGALLVVRQVTRVESSAVELILGVGTAAASYAIALGLLPGGVAQLKVLGNDLLVALKRRFPRRGQAARNGDAKRPVEAPRRRSFAD